MKAATIINIALSVIVIILLLTRNEQIVTNNVTVDFDTSYVMSELRKLQFEAKKDSIVYVTESDFKRFETIREPIVYYYSDTVTIIQNNERPIAANLTKDTIETKDGFFYSRILSSGPVYNNELTYKLNIPQITKTVTNTIEIEPKNRILLGGSVGGNSQQFEVSSGLMLQNKKGHAIGYRYDFLSKTHHVPLYFNIFEFDNLPKSKNK